MKYFSVEELCNSVTAKKKGIDNSPTPEVKAHLVELIENLLDKFREAWGSGIKVSSGYRSPALNKAVGGSKTSAHNAGYAADLIPANGKMAEFKAFATKWLKESGIAFDQLILEKSGASEWVHIGIKNGSGQQRKQYLKYLNGKYTTFQP